MKPQRRNLQPCFLWQGLLILLPIAALAAAGLYTLRKDRAIAMEEARQRARDALHSLAVDLASGLPERLKEAELFTIEWLEYGQRGPADRAKDEHPAAWNSNSPPWRPNPTQIPAFLPLIYPVGSDVGDRSRSGSDLPAPPSWWTGLTAAGQCAWNQLETAATQDSDVFSNACHEFTAHTPSRAARLNAEWLQLKRSAKPGPPALSNLVHFAERVRATESPSGLPLSTLVLLEAVSQAQSTGLSAPLWKAIGREVSERPTILSPLLLDQLDALCRRRSDGIEEAKALRVAWAYAERRRALHEFLREKGWLQKLAAGPTQTWVYFGNEPVFCFSHNAPVSPATDGAAGNPIALSIHCYPKALLEQTVEQTVKESKVTVPDYLALRIELMKEPVLPRNSSAAEMEQLAGEQFTLPAARMAANPNTGPGGALSRSGSAADAPPRPEVRLAAVLANPARLLSMQNQRRWLFIGLFSVAVLTACVGLISTRRTFQQQQRLVQLKDNFVSSVSHELRAPIASMRLMAENLEARKVTDPGQQREYFRLMSQECRRLSSLIINVLDFSRIEQGRKHYEFEPTDLPALVRDTCLLMQPYATERQVTLEPAITLSATAAPVVDGKAIQQALINLVDNAIKHAPAGSVVSIGLASLPASPSSFELWVEDRGPGIPAEEHQRIFERFYRLGSELRRETPGVGIGLSLVKHIVEAHGGSISVASAPGRGSRFTLCLPGTDTPDSPGREST